MKSPIFFIIFHRLDAKLLFVRVPHSNFSLIDQFTERRAHPACDSVDFQNIELSKFLSNKIETQKIFSNKNTRKILEKCLKN